ncbi:MAG TPA: hypothetical protein VHX60_14380 [Acidobacteriaceae bacterium]|nr:hypothetical protein [Acidobacteriaceae bacterium]
MYRQSAPTTPQERSGGQLQQRDASWGAERIATALSSLLLVSRDVFADKAPMGKATFFAERGRISILPNDLKRVRRPSPPCSAAGGWIDGGRRHTSPLPSYTRPGYFERCRDIAWLVPRFDRINGLSFRSLPGYPEQTHVRHLPRSRHPFTTGSFLIDQLRTQLSPALLGRISAIFTPSDPDANSLLQLTSALPSGYGVDTAYHDYRMWSAAEQDARLPSRRFGPGESGSRVLLVEAVGMPRLNFQVIRRTIATRAQGLGSVKDIQSHLRHPRADTTANEYLQELPESVQRLVGTVFAMLTRGANSGTMKLSLAARCHQKPNLYQRILLKGWWAQQDSNLRLPPCEGGTKRPRCWQQ